MNVMYVLCKRNNDHILAHTQIFRHYGESAFAVTSAFLIHNWCFNLLYCLPVQAMYDHFNPLRDVSGLLLLAFSPPNLVFCTVTDFALSSHERNTTGNSCISLEAWLKGELDWILKTN